MTRWLSILCVAAFSAASQLPAAADQAPQAAKTAKGAIAPEAEDLLRKMAAFYKTPKTAGVAVRQTVKITGPNTRQQIVSNVSLALQRPNRLAFLQKDAVPGADVICDGKMLTTSFKLLKRYSSSAAPASFDLLSQAPAITKIGNPAQLQMALTLFSEDPFAKLIEGVETLSLGGSENIGGKTTTIIKATQPAMDWILWVETGERPLLRRMRLDMSKANAEDKLPADRKMEMTLDFTDWKLDPELPEDTFAFTPPEGASDSVESPVIGKVAPAVSLELLGGGTFDASKHRGKEVVILGFWATWSAPSVRALPVLSELAAEYRDKGVAFYTINQGEDAKTIKDFLAAAKLNVPVALDINTEAGMRYAVQGIPQIVLINRTGFVRVVHVGVTPGLKEILHRHLDALVQ